MKGFNSIVWRFSFKDTFHFLADLLAERLTDWLADWLSYFKRSCKRWPMILDARVVDFRAIAVWTLHSTRKQRLKWWSSLRYVIRVSFFRLTRSKPNKEEKYAIDEVDSWKPFTVAHPLLLLHRSFRTSGSNPNRKPHNYKPIEHSKFNFISKINIRTLSRRPKLSRRHCKILVNNARLLLKSNENVTRQFVFESRHWKHTRRDIN